jgi:hypothetical protein
LKHKKLSPVSAALHSDSKLVETVMPIRPYVRLIVLGIVASAAGLSSAGQGLGADEAPPKSGIRFQVIPGDENGSKEILDKRHAEVTEKKGAKLASHDWWLWDGHLDVLTAATAEAGFFRNDGKGGFRLQPGPLTDLLRSRDPYLHRADTADFDNDGLLDLIVSKPRHGPKVIFANLGAGKVEVLHKAQGWDSDPVVVCDLNDDGLLDVAIGGPANQVTLFLNTTPTPGTVCRLYPRLPAPNLYAVGTRVEVFRAGTLGKVGSRPVLIEDAHPDAIPIHIGLGREKQFDLRATFPGKPPVELQNVQAHDRLQLTPDGKRTPPPAADQ